MKSFKAFILENLFQKKVHQNPTAETMKALAKNNKYGSARFVIYKDGSHVAGDSEHHTHQDIAPANAAWHTRGIIGWHGGKKYTYTTFQPFSNHPSDHPKLRHFEKMGIEKGN